MAIPVETTNFDLDISRLNRTELEEQLAFYKDELDKKDQLIRDLMRTSVSDSQTSSNASSDSSRITSERNELRTNLEQLKMKLDEHRSLIEQKDLTITELRTENASLKSQNLEKLSKIESLETSVKESTNQLKRFESTQGQQEMVVQALQNDVKEKNSKIFELKGRFRSSEKRLNDLLLAEQEAKSKLIGAMEEMSKILQCESTPESLMVTLIELVQTNSSQKTLLAQKTDEKDEFEFAQRAARETILRLSGELNKEQKEKEATTEALRILKEETQKLKSSLEESEQRSVLLNDRIKQLTNALQLAREDATEKDKKLAVFSDAKTRVLGKMILSQETDGKAPSEFQLPQSPRNEYSRALTEFLTHLASWLSIPREDGLLSFLATAEHRIQNLLEELKGAEMNRQKVEDHMLGIDKQAEMTRHIEELERRLASGTEANDRLRREKRLLDERIRKIIASAKLDGALPTLDTEAACEAVILRLSQLQQNDTELQSKLRLQITRLQKQLKEAKEKAETLELQVCVLRSRVGESQERKTPSWTPASQTPSSLSASEKERRRLAKQLQQSKEEADELRKEIVELKAKLLEISQEKLEVIGQAKAVRSNESKLNEYTRTCERQKTELQALSEQLQQERAKYEEALMNIQRAMGEVDRDLKTTKEALDVSRRSEKQLLEFRALVARHLGMDDDKLTVPDYQIMVKLDQMINDCENRMISNTAIRKAMELTNLNGDDR